MSSNHNDDDESLCNENQDVSCTFATISIILLVIILMSSEGEDVRAIANYIWFGANIIGLISVLYIYLVHGEKAWVYGFYFGGMLIWNILLF